MRLNDFVGLLINDGIMVLNVSKGEVTDYLVSGVAEKTLIRQLSGKLSARILGKDDKIINEELLEEHLDDAPNVKTDL